MAVRSGLDMLIDGKFAALRGARVGAVVHPASVASDLRHTADVLSAQDSFRLVSLFGPQHGARGEKQDNMIESESYRDPDTGVPVHSLYAETRWPTDEMMKDVDVLVYDLQDVGTRVYTFIYTLSYCMEACGRLGKKLVVLDRPNPVGGRHVEGNLLDMEYRSFVGMYPLPMRHGLTVGELALYYRDELGIACDLKIVPMEGWRRAMWFEETGLPWVLPSPNMATVDTAVVYPGMVLVEGTTLSEGRGTTRPFEFVGAPYIRSRDLSAELNSLALPGVLFRPHYFEPTFQKQAGRMCGGVQIHVTDRGVFEPFLSGLVSIATIRRMYPEHFTWREPPYEYEFSKLPIEILCGGRLLVDMMERASSPDEFRASWASDTGEFHRRRRGCLLYD
jgi:uncharacterized protein YbbC (DUF1343 family)